MKPDPYLIRVDNRKLMDREMKRTETYIEPTCYVTKINMPEMDKIIERLKTIIADEHETHPIPKKAEE